MRSLSLLCLAIGLLPTSQVLAQSSMLQLDRGRPLITNYSADDYGAEMQNWGAVQDPRGVLYIANNAGVLEFDGQTWRLIRLGQNSAARGVSVDAQGRVFVGAFGDFGMLVPDEKGQLTFVSLAKIAELGPAGPGDVMTTFVHAEGVLFESSTGLYVYRDGKVTVHRPEVQFGAGVMVRGRFFVRDRGKGLYEFRNSRLEYVVGSEPFREDRVFCMLPAQDGGIVVGARNSGFRMFYPDAEPQARFKLAPAFDALAKELAGQKVSVCDVLQDGRFALATAQSGLYLTTADGQLLEHLDKRRGIFSDSVYHVYVDRRGNLVLSLGAGVAYVETASPYSLINDKDGVGGLGNLTYLVQDRASGRSDRLYLGTYQGLFYRESAAQAFQFVKGSMESWDFLRARDQLLFAHNDGVARLVEDELKAILSGRICLTLLSPRGHPDLVLAGSLEGIWRLGFQNGEWRELGRVEGFNKSTFRLTEAPDGGFWLYTYTADGLFKLTLSEDYSKVVAVRNYTTRDGLPSDGGNFLFSGRSGLFFGTTRGVYRMDPARDAFEPDPRFQPVPGVDNAVHLLHEDPAGNLILVAEQVSGMYRRGADGSYAFEQGALGRLRYFRTGEYIGAPYDNSILVSYQDGFVRFDLDFKPPATLPFAALMRRVETSEGALFEGATTLTATPAAETDAAKTTPALRELPYAQNGLRLAFAAPFFQGANQVEFRYRLEGFDKDWSAWRRQTEASYTNLPEGRYTFRVSARNVFGEVSRDAVFGVKILPPWYRSAAAYIGYVLGGSLFIYAVSALTARLRVRALRNKNRELELVVAARTVELAAANESLQAVNTNMRVVLDNVDQGLVMIDRAGTTTSERSAALDAWFGHSPPGTNFAELLAPEDDEQAATLRFAYEQLTEGILPAELTLDQFPKELVKGQQHYALAFKPIEKDGHVDATLLMVSDVTSRVTAERADEKLREQLKAFERILRDRFGFIEFFVESETLVYKVAHAEFVSDAAGFRAVHTLKGNAALFDANSIANIAHRLEQAMLDGQADAVESERQNLFDSWDDFARRVAPLLGKQHQDRMDLTVPEWREMLLATRERRPLEEVRRMLLDLGGEPIDVRLARVAEQVTRLSLRLGKGTPEVALHGSPTRLPPRRYTRFWSAFAHVVRNVVGHGFQLPEDRVRQGKPEANRLKLSGEVRSGRFIVEITDDGHGIDWARVAEKARAAALPATTRAELVLALLHPGVSTASELNQVSGRGVGMAAVAKEIEDLGGTIQVESELNKGTRFVFNLPLFVIEDSDVEARAEGVSRTEPPLRLTSNPPLRSTGSPPLG